MTISDENQSRIEAQCAAKGMRMTEQRRIIARVLSGAADHPDVEELHRRCVAIDPRISISTVYRTVNLFEDAGIIERHDFRQGRARYEQMRENHHDHLINLRTGQVIEFQSEEIERLQAEVARKLGYKLVDHRLDLYAVPLDDKAKRLGILGGCAHAPVDRPCRSRRHHPRPAAVSVDRRKVQSSRMRRRIPIFYHRMICRLIGVNIARRRQEVGRYTADDRLEPCLVARYLGDHGGGARRVHRQAGSRRLADIRSARETAAHRVRQPQPASEDGRCECGDRARLAGGDPVVLFGEGTSSDGNRVLEFRSALIGAAREAVAQAEHVSRVWLQPLSIAYTGMLGLPLGRQHRPLIAWYGDFELAPHLAEVIRRGSIDVTLTWGAPIPVGRDLGSQGDHPDAGKRASGG